jgi:C1q domain
VKFKVVVVDLELTARTKTIALRAGILAAVLSAAAVAIAAANPLHTWAAGDTLAATDLNGNFSNLAGQITALQAQSHPASAFHANLTSPTTIQSGTATPIVFDQVVFDVASEYSATTGAFTAKQAGIYLIVCTIEYSLTSSDGLYQAEILLNGSRAGLTEVNASSTYTTYGVTGVTPEQTMISQLSTNDVVTCGGGQYTGGAVAVYATGSLTRFEMARLY